MNATTLNSSLWKALESVLNQSAATGSWKRRLGDEFPFIASTFFRRLEEPATGIWCEECYCGHEVITYPDGECFGVCQCEDRNCDEMRLTPEDITCWELNWTKLGRAVARAFQVDPREAEFGVRPTRQIGTFGGAELPIVLSVAQDRAEMRYFVAELAARMRDGFVLMAPTAQFVDLHVKELLSHARAGFVDLESNVILMRDGSLQPRQAPGELFARWLPNKPEPVAEDVAQNAFALLKRLEAEAPAKPPTVVTVFQQYCVEARSAEQVALRCGCSKGTVMNRLRIIEDQTGIKPEQLRTLSGQFGRMDVGLTDHRAARIYRRGLTDDTEEDAEE